MGREGAVKYFGAELVRNRDGTVGAAAIEDNNFLGHAAHRLQEPWQIVLFILRDDAYAQAIHQDEQATEACASILQEYRPSPRPCEGQSQLLNVKIKANGVGSDPKFRAILENRRADALVFEKSAICGFQIFQTDKAIADFDQTVVTGKFGIFEGEVCAFSADNGARLSQRVGDANQRSANHRKNNSHPSEKLKALARGRKFKAGRGSVRAGERRHRRDDDSLISTPLDLHDSRLAAAGTTKLHFRMLGDDFVLQDMLTATMNTRCLHYSKVPRQDCEKTTLLGGLATSVTHPL